MRDIIDGPHSGKQVDSEAAVIDYYGNRHVWSEDRSGYLYAPNGETVRRIPLLGGPHNGEVQEVFGNILPGYIIRPSMGRNYRYGYRDGGYYHAPHAEAIASKEKSIALPYDETKEALTAALAHIEGNLRQIEQEPHAPRTLLAIQTLYAADKARIEKLLTHFTS